MNVGYMFAVPLAETRMDNPESLCESLTQLFLEKERQGDTWRNELKRDTQHGPLFESRFDLFQWPDPPVRSLAGFCHTSLASVLKEICEYSDEEFSRLVFDYHSWFHVTRKGGYQGLHHHQNASWSGIFCVDPGDVMEDRPQSGAVRFHDSRSYADQYMDDGNRRLNVTCRHGSYQIQHEAGKLMMFPSYLDHEIFPYEGERPRVVVAFNCSINFDTQTA